LLASLFSYSNGEWVAITPEGFFESSENGAKSLTVRRGSEVYAIDQFYEGFHRPDLVQQKLAGDPQGKVSAAVAELNLASAVSSGAAPRVRIVSPMPSTELRGDHVAVDTEVTDRGGGIGKIEWRVNGTLLGLDATGSVRSNGRGQTTRATRTLPLKPGDNCIEVSAFNEKNAFGPGTIDRAQIVVRVVHILFRRNRGSTCSQ
jgi:hypothetical protein